MTPLFVDKNKILIINFSWGNKNYKVTLDDNLLNKLTWPHQHLRDSIAICDEKYTGGS
jgi:hypothetical protein